jgi:hypothetical protein
LNRKPFAALAALVLVAALGACTPTETYFTDTCPPGYHLRGMQCLPDHSGFWQGHYYPATPLRPTRVERVRPVVREKTVVKQRTGIFGSKTTTYRSTVRSSRR